jgi:hypothetical protein
MMQKNLSSRAALGFLACLLFVAGCAGRHHPDPSDADLVAKLDNGMVKFHGEYLGLRPEIRDDAAKKVRCLGEAAIPLLVEAMRDPQRYVIAHALLTRMSDEPYKVSAAHFNGLHVDIWPDGKVEYDEKDQPVLETRWRKWLEKHRAAASGSGPDTRQGTANQRRSIVEQILEGIIVEGVVEVASYLPRIAEVAVTASEYHRVHAAWPRERSDLTEFAEARGIKLDLSEFADLRIEPIGDGQRACMGYVVNPRGTDGTISGQVEVP